MSNDSPFSVHFGKNIHSQMDDHWTANGRKNIHSQMDNHWTANGRSLDQSRLLCNTNILSLDAVDSTHVFPQSVCV